ncbi:Rib/alpha-like domain-containing protein [uncultured Arcanobacterium sp.]|uniref:Rib/alpha-like domain-containing protein n=1 Tax=uncultured Arcanobacterium sp. TaxID=487520 RepID=UPI00261DA311|nr:Rib/alpha-like domain-containing protein [uncultured Arcanobacterium sp.]
MKVRFNRSSEKRFTRAISIKAAAFLGCIALLGGGIFATQAQAAPPGNNPVYQSPEEDTVLTFTPGASPMAGTIESPAEKGAKNSISGTVLFRRGGALNDGINSASRPIPMKGVRVYAQWLEKRGASPIYWAVTDEKGEFNIAMKPVNMANAKKLEFDANPMLGQAEKVRVWAENPDNKTYAVLYNYTMGTLWPNVPISDVANRADWNLATKKLTNVNIAFGEAPKPEVMHLDKPAATEAKQAGGFIEGTVFWNLDRLVSGVSWSNINSKNSSDIPANSKVTISYLSDYALQRIYSDGPAAIRFDGKIRDLKWNSVWEAKLQNWIKREMAKEGKKKWIAESVTVDSDPATGKYVAQFKGIWGSAWDTSAKVGGLWTQEEVDRLHTLALSADTGSWGATPVGEQKHINKDWMFISTSYTPGVGITSPWHMNGYLSESISWKIWNLNQSNLSFTPESSGFDVYPYNITDNFAKPGDTAHTATTGLPTEAVNKLQYQIEWTETETGKVVKTCDAVSADRNGGLPSCDYQVAADLKGTTSYTAILYAYADGKRGVALAADSFTAAIGNTPVYELTKVLPGKSAVSGEPEFADAKGSTANSAEVKKQVVKYELAEAAADAAAPGTASIDAETGKITLQTTAEQAGKDFFIPMKATFKDGSVRTGIAPFKVLKDTDGDGLPDPNDPDNPQNGEDFCPTVFGPDFNDGCPLPKWNDGVTDVKTPIDLPNVGDNDLRDYQGNPVAGKVTKLPAGAQIVVKGNGEAEFAAGADGVKDALHVTPKNAKDGDKILLTVKTADGKHVIDDAVVDIWNDEDGDGVRDKDDDCPGTPAGTPVNERGCPLPTADNGKTTATGKLPKTGAPGAAGVFALAAVLMGAGIGMRSRRAD